MKTLEDFSPEIKAKVPVYIEKYTKGIFDGGRYKAFNTEDAEALIDWSYEKGGLKKPVILVAENPYESQAIFNCIKANKEVFAPIIHEIYRLKNGIPENIGEPTELIEKLGAQLYFQLYSKLVEVFPDPMQKQLYTQIDSQLDLNLERIEAKLNKQLKLSLDTRAYAKITAKQKLHYRVLILLHDSIDRQLDLRIHSQLRGVSPNSTHQEFNINTYLFTAGVYSSVLTAWWNFVSDELDIKSEAYEDLKTWDELYSKSGVYSAICTDMLCVVSKYPKKINRDATGNLHSLNGVAVEWGKSSELTSFDCYYINGLNVSKQMLDRLARKGFTFEDFVKEDDEEVKSAILSFYSEKFGDEFMFRFFSDSLEVVDTYVDNNDPKYLEGTEKGVDVGMYTLFKGEVLGEDLAYVRYYCPLKDKMSFISVDPANSNAKDAIASLYKLPRKLKEHIAVINRQSGLGSLYRSNFTEEGSRVSETLTESEEMDLVNLDGDTYFSKINY